MARKKEPKKKKKLAVSKKTKNAVRKPKKIKHKRKVAKRKKKVSAIPKGYHTITPYLIVSNAKEAIEFYKNIFGAKVVMRMERPDGNIAHSELKIGDAKFMLADQCPEMMAHSPTAYGGSPVSIHLYVKNVDNVVKRAVSAGAKLTRAVEDMFYGDRSGSLEDPFGHKWFVSTHIEDVTPAQIRKRAAALFGK